MLRLQQLCNGGPFGADLAAHILTSGAYIKFASSDPRLTTTAWETDPITKRIQSSRHGTMPNIMEVGIAMFLVDQRATQLEAIAGMESIMAGIGPVKFTQPLILALVDSGVIPSALYEESVYWRPGLPMPAASIAELYMMAYIHHLRYLDMPSYRAKLTGYVIPVKHAFVSTHDRLVIDRSPAKFHDFLVLTYEDHSSNGRGTVVVKGANRYDVAITDDVVAVIDTTDIGKVQKRVWMPMTMLDQVVEFLVLGRGRAVLRDATVAGVNALFTMTSQFCYLIPGTTDRKYALYTLANSIVLPESDSSAMPASPWLQVKVGSVVQSVIKDRIITESETARTYQLFTGAPETGANVGDALLNVRVVDRDIDLLFEPDLLVNKSKNVFSLKYIAKGGVR